MTTRYTYFSGLRTREDAARALDDLMIEDDISEAERPQIEPYTRADGQRRYKITLEH